MNSDLEYIQKYYGEKMMQFCLDSFSSSLEKRGTLSKVFEDNFAHSHNLYNDLMNSCLLDDFKAYIGSLIMVEKEGFYIKEGKTPQELVAKVGYTVYEFSEDGRIKSFKKQYLSEDNNESNQRKK